MFFSLLYFFHQSNNKTYYITVLIFIAFQLYLCCYYWHYLQLQLVSQPRMKSSTVFRNRTRKPSINKLNTSKPKKQHLSSNQKLSKTSIQQTNMLDSIVRQVNNDILSKCSLGNPMMSISSKKISTPFLDKNVNNRPNSLKQYLTSLIHQLQFTKTTTSKLETCEEESNILPDKTSYFLFSILVIPICFWFTSWQKERHCQSTVSKKTADSISNKS